MPKKLLPVQDTPSAVAERLSIWGKTVRTQRVTQRMPALHLCVRMGISDATLRRMERGDPGVSAGTYLTALWVLGILDSVAPRPDTVYWSADPQARVRSPREDDDGYF